MKLSLPWPPSILSPNARVHWSKKAAAAKKYRHDCGWIAKGNPIPTLASPMLITIRFFPPDKRTRDLDNMLSSIKSCLDSVAEVWGINDREFRPTLEIGAPRKFGVVEIEC